VREPKLADVVLFAGAGVSRNSGAPGFKQLRDFFLSPVLGEDVEAIGMQDLSPEQIFDALDDGLPSTHEAIRAELWRACERGEPNRNHYALALLGSAGGSVWTPNFDTLIERAASRLGIGWQALTSAQLLDPPPQHEQPLVIKKLHGSFPYTGDPPREPAVHDYPLLFQRTALWNRLQKAWSDRLAVAVAGRHVYLYGHRGADLDIMPVLLEILPSAAAVQWWELKGENLDRLSDLFVDVPHVQILEGDPSAALQRLATRLCQTTGIPSADPVPARLDPPGGYTGRLTYRARASLLGQFRGSSYARRLLLLSIVLDPAPLRSSSALGLLRSAGFDIPELGLLIAGALRAATRLPRSRQNKRIWEIYAAILDALPLRHSDARDLARLASSPFGERAELLTRIASKRKRIGDLQGAAATAEQSLTDLTGRQTPHPAMEGMTAYNLIWIYRQSWQIERRTQILDIYRERMPHIGFNWAGWIGLEEALIALTTGDSRRAREVLQNPRMRYVRRIKHPAYMIDDDLANLLVNWSEHGPPGIDLQLEDLVRRFQSHHVLYKRAYSRINALLLLADHARVSGNKARLHQWLQAARKDSLSQLQHEQAKLIEAVATEDSPRLRQLARQPRFGLIAATAQTITGEALAPARIECRPSGPLPALF
jgi:hypothetical protein